MFRPKISESMHNTLRIASQCEEDETILFMYASKEGFWHFDVCFIIYLMYILLVGPFLSSHLISLSLILSSRSLYFSIFP